MTYYRPRNQRELLIWIRQYYPSFVMRSTKQGWYMYNKIIRDHEDQLIVSALEEVIS